VFGGKFLKLILGEPHEKHAVQGGILCNNSAFAMRRRKNMVKP